MTRVRLLEKPECGLCAEALACLRRLRRELSLDIERVDISADRALFDRYGLRTPVIVVGREELDVASIDDAAIARWLRAVQ